MTRLCLQACSPGAGGGSAGAGQPVASGLGSSALAREGASPSWRDKLGVSLFPERGEEVEPPGYCVLRERCLRDILSSAPRWWWENVAPVGRAGGNWVVPGALFVATGDPQATVPAFGACWWERGAWQAAAL